jgi:hypothetical protein
MTKIKTYIQDDNITNKDIVLGSDGDQNNKTKNYTVQGLKTFITKDFEASEQDNIIKSYTLPAIDTPNTNLTVLEEAASLISNISPSITINADEILFFKLKRGDKFYVLSLKGLGKGIYGINETQVTKDNLQVISEKALVVENIVEDSTTDLINLGEIQPLNISQAVNAINPPIEIQALSEGFTVFRVRNNGAVESYLFQGDSGLTGFGEQQTELSDFNLVEETGVTEGFVDLSDTPNNYAGNQANVVKVNSFEDGLEFGTLDADEIDDSQTTNKFTTQTDIDRLKNTSGTNTGDQDISGISANSGRIDDVVDALSGKADKKTDKAVASGTYTLLASDVDKHLMITAPCTVVVPNGLASDLEFQGEQVGGDDTDVISFVAESGGTLNVTAAFQAKTDNEFSVFGIRTHGSDVATIYGTLKLAE